MDDGFPSWGWHKIQIIFFSQLLTYYVVTRETSISLRSTVDTIFIMHQSQESIKAATKKRDNLVPLDLSNYIFSQVIYKDKKDPFFHGKQREFSTRGICEKFEQVRMQNNI